ncbi:hypothetical protein INT43_004092 [Umbelopsis isabellina]|uniref:Uncharacterized protein n=1 Tax=Mortierella isabellina TaxID=91625 RepID=A0A8H7PU77_MORIS|nr:hypothetical protein INT43_004092 [Umbelopsis isabellina]
MQQSTKMYHRLDSSSYAPYNVNIWIQLKDLILSIQGHMFWIYSALFCILEESNNSAQRSAELKNAPKSPLSSQSNTVQKKSSYHVKKLVVIKDSDSMDSRTNPNGIPTMYQHRNASVLSVSSRINSMKTKADSTIEPLQMGQQKSKDHWQNPFSNMIKRRKPRGSIHPLEPVRASASTPAFTTYSVIETERFKGATRRSSAPTLPRYDPRPSMHEERNGITRPPRWWRKMTSNGWVRRNSA